VEHASPALSQRPVGITSPVDHAGRQEAPQVARQPKLAWCLRQPLEEDIVDDVFGHASVVEQARG